ncbi:Ribosomal protein L30 [Spironucleus salmonicida]|uniref:Ribosomal protein L30 n=1 Tax=Spironucleus salmonicida TaxID=348837 RepID=V6LRA1_9EUKA|nr:Ribosomal protein L30 [Spironucleus salmonicida]|eukprot:EST43309.1 Ribosomal protein L30 [Spironucleus salmonicida]
MADRNQTKKQLESTSLQLGLIMKSGKFTLGVNQAMKSIRDGSASLIIISSNLPQLVTSQIEYMAMIQKIQVYKQPYNSRDFGLQIGKTFNVGVMTITNAGDADLSAFRN